MLGLMPRRTRQIILLIVVVLVVLFGLYYQMIAIRG